MNRRLPTIALAAVIVVTAGCAARPDGPQPPIGNDASSTSLRPTDYGNIRWNKAAIHVYKSKPPQTAVLTFWARDGYSLYPPSCENGGKFTATPGTVKGNPNRYDHVPYTFVAKTGKPDTCNLTAVLDNTGSPPFTILTIHLNS